MKMEQHFNPGLALISLSGTTPRISLVVPTQTERSLLLFLPLILIIKKLTGCKESQFYSLPFGQAVASMY